MINGKMVSNMTYSRGESLGDGNVAYKVVVLEGKGKGDGEGERKRVEASSANGVIDVGVADMILGGCMDGRVQMGYLMWVLLLLGCILIVVANTCGLMNGFDDVDDS